MISFLDLYFSIKLFYMIEKMNELAQHNTDISEPFTPPNIESAISPSNIHRIISSNEQLILQQVQTIRLLQSQLSQQEKQAQLTQNKYLTLMATVNDQLQNQNSSVDNLLVKIVELQQQLSTTKVRLAIQSQQLLVANMQLKQYQELQKHHRNTFLQYNKLEIAEYFQTQALQRDSSPLSPQKNSEQTQQWIKFLQQYHQKPMKVRQKTSSLIKKFIPQEIRLRAWQSLLQNRLGMTHSLYMHLLERRQKDWVCQKARIQIAKDVKRSFYGKASYDPKSSIVQQLTEILQLFHLFRPDISYVQGMTYPAIVLISTLGKIKAFTLFCNLVLGNNFFRQLYTLEGSFVGRVSRCFDRLLEQYNPKASQQLKKFDIQSQIFLIEWLFTFFSRGLTLQTTLKLWDHIVFYQELAIFRMALSVFQQLSPLLEEVSYEQSLSNIRQFYQQVSEQSLLEGLVNSKLTAQKLARTLEKCTQQKKIA